MRIHSNSPLGQLERCYNTRICPLCLVLGGVSIKPIGKAICFEHMSQAPIGFKCPIFRETNGTVKCGFKQQSEGNCPIHSLVLVPYWPYKPDYPEWLKGKAKIKKIVYAQLGAAKGERGLEVIDNIGAMFNISGYKILEQVDKAEKLDRILREYSRTLT
jgi:hypothetical protein